MRFEGGKVQDPDDPGGATAYGVSLRFLKSRGEIEAFDYDGDGDLDADDVMAMEPRDAEEIYRRFFWAEWFEDLPPVVAMKFFDFSVNIGEPQATRNLQRALNDCPRDPLEVLHVDGRLGPRTMSVMFKTNPRLLIGNLEDQSARFYYGLAETRQASRKYLFGWLRRCYSRP